jgi:NAD(P)-dependent dehydrogenase (short-subunit alcohol dehydrogenase family)
MQDLTGRTAFVTGAASGIGLGIATALSHAGVNVMLCDIEEEALATAVAKLQLTNADVDGVRADVSLKADLQAAADATVSRYGKVEKSIFWSTMRGSPAAGVMVIGQMRVGIGFSTSI